jgi:chloride channel 3/4/5
MAHDPHERTHLLDPRVAEVSLTEGGEHRPKSAQGSEAASIISSHISKDEEALGATAIGERLPYNDYTTIDWLHDLVGHFLHSQHCT